MPLPGETDMLINFVADDKDLAFFNCLPQGIKIGVMPYGGGRIVRRVKDHQSGTFAEYSAKFLPVDAKRRRLQRDTFNHPAG